MTKTIQALFDGSVLRPEEPLLSEANTRVRLIIDPVPAEETAPTSFLATARALELQGPTDWSSRVDERLYGDAD